jgi:hypothetical protein
MEEPVDAVGVGVGDGVGVLFVVQAVCWATASDAFWVMSVSTIF